MGGARHTGCRRADGCAEPEVRRSNKQKEKKMGFMQQPVFWSKITEPHKRKKHRRKGPKIKDYYFVGLGCLVGKPSRVKNILSPNLLFQFGLVSFVAPKQKTLCFIPL